MCVEIYVEMSVLKTNRNSSQCKMLEQSDNYLELLHFNDWGYEHPLEMMMF